jgi:hypothetical protein
LHTLFLLSGGTQIPIMRVRIVVTLNGTPEVLMDGVMSNYEVRPGADAGHSTLTVIGEDLSLLMDYIDFSGWQFPAMPPEARVAFIVAKYAMFGIVPMVIPSVLLDIPIPVAHIPQQQGTDLCYVKQLARDVGYVFYLDTSLTPGATVAYWGPQIKVGEPQPALNINMDAHTNVESLDFNFDAESAVLPLLLLQNRETKLLYPIPVLDITPLSPPLGAVPPIPKKIEPIIGTAKLSPVRAALIGMAQAAQKADAVSATGSLNVLRYGRVLKARRLVGVRGAGTAFNGLYYVQSVTHNIKRGEYTQQFTLSRNGLISTLPKVPA